MNTNARPILFSGPMVCAILNGSKTQTRRFAKVPWLPGANPQFSQARPFSNGGQWCIAGGSEMSKHFRCPYGQPGDRLWVRETWNVFTLSRDHDESWPFKEIPAADPRLDEDARCSVCVDYPVASLPGHDGGTGPWRPAIHMPRWASRITLTVTDVRVQRLRDISEEDARAEGVEIDGETGAFWGAEGRGVTPGATSRFSNPVSAFADIWRSINGPDSWKANPFVWAISFAVEKPADARAAA